MNKKGAIIIIEDSHVDQRIFKEIFKRLMFNNELCFFSDGNDALHFLNTTRKMPFMIISDINMPRLNGIELRAKIHENEELALRCVPFLFFSTGADKESVAEAYSLAVQGFFRKSMDIEDLERTIRKVVEYWQECIAPSDYC
jgi:CheY-like chemotaxis protein